MQTQCIYISEAENSTSVCFDTGMDPRSFARAKMFQGLNESGYIFRPDGSHETWKPSGVNEINGKMQIWGSLFDAKRLDLLIETSCGETPCAEEQQLVLAAIVSWIKAKIHLAKTHPAHAALAAHDALAAYDSFGAQNPGAVFINPNGDVFFAPEQLSNRCLLMEGMEYDRYNCPDLSGMEAAAFCAGAMLYTILTKTHPYPTDGIYQDMRDGVFMPVHLAAANLNKELSALIQSALMLPVKTKGSSQSIPVRSGKEILKELSEILANKGNLFCALTDEENSQLQKQKENYLLKEKTIIKASRYARHNKLLLGAIAAGLIFLFFFAGSLIRSHLDRPTTAGLNSYAVIATYFEAFNALDHVLMEACLTGKADKSDISIVLNLFVISRIRQAYESMNDTAYIPAETWIQQGTDMPAENVFGAADFSITQIGGSEADGRVLYQVDYIFFTPDQSAAIARRDIFTLMQDRRGNWRITEILRTEK